MGCGTTIPLIHVPQYRTIASNMDYSAQRTRSSGIDEFRRRTLKYIDKTIEENAENVEDSNIF